ncbi:hypothetical protein BASA81_007826 [Batrachochytrium salamandrivorans]|nr:hypothetical protein BASA81_007826 [Batrachochytrium salamandrivorans]
MPPASAPLLSPTQLYHLIPYIPTILAWLRHQDPASAGDLFLSPSHADEVENTLREFINAINFNGELTNVQLRYIFFCHDKLIWASCVRKILLESEPRMISNEIGNALTSKLSEVHNAADGDEASKIVGAVLDQLPRSVFLAFGDLCAFLRDTCTNSGEMAFMMGPMLLCPRIAGGSQAAQAAAAIMDMLIDEAETVFGRVAGFGKKDAMGVRKPPPASRNATAAAAAKILEAPNASSPPLAPPRGFSVSEPLDLTPAASSHKQEQEMKQSKDQKRRDQLRAFFEFQNSRVKFAEIVDDLFDNHDFEDIAKGVYEKFHILPAGWQHDLVERRNQGSTKLGWFDEQKINQQKARHQAGRPLSLVVPPSPNLGKSPPTGNKVDLIINEIIDTEETFRDNMDELHQQYILPVREIALGKKGKDAAEELCLTSTDVERIFGWRIAEIVKVSTALQKKLEVVNLCRGEVRSPLGRRGKVAEAFVAIAGDLHVYAPYVSAHRTSLQTLEKALNLVNSKTEKPSNGLFGNKKQQDTGVTFVKMWDTVSQSSTRLKGQSIQSLLIMPIQRVPRYKLLLGECVKSTEPDHPAYALLTEALELINQQAKQINEALRQHEKLEKFFGQDGMMSPSMSEKDATGKIRQGYVDA